MPQRRTRARSPESSPESSPARELARHGLTRAGQVSWNFSTSALYEEAIRRREGSVARGGALVVRTGQHTGRSPNDKYVVREPSSESHVWWGPVNRAMSSARFARLHRRMLSSLRGKDLFIQDCAAGADPAYRRSIRVMTESAWHSLFARTMFIVEDRTGFDPAFTPDYTVLHAPSFGADPEIDGTNSPTFIVVNFGQKLILIGGTGYAGEIKKSVFTLMNYLLPLAGVLSMHCSANIAPDGEVAVFFGLSGTGKTTLSADRRRTLIGDDEHGWSDHGVFNIEGGCYAKMIRLSAASEPEIFSVTRRFGTVLENVALDPESRRLDLDDDSLTENTRGAYPLCYIPNASRTGCGGHPRDVIMLTCDAFGVLPPIARLTPAQAMFHFLSGYTAKVAGTELGVTEPQATFSTCFGAPFMALDPIVYAKLLGDKIAEQRTRCWLVNTGWSGGAYGAGKRIKIELTRAIIDAALGGALDEAPTRRDPVFGMDAVARCPDVPETVLDPRRTWQDPSAYDAKARELAQRFRKNFAQFDGRVPPDVRQAAPEDGAVGARAASSSPGGGP
ncbi:MAG TPA: phosphoenolpyruvate carboxykinase [bacterium]